MVRKVGGKIRGLIFVISGPSGSGKTTLLNRLLKTTPLKNKLSRSISFTTRPRRSGERNGRDYLFVTETEFKDRLKKKKILEWTRYLGYYYATPKDSVESRIRQGRDIALCLDLKGARKIRQAYPNNTITIFILPPSIESLRERMHRRCRKTRREEVANRVKLAKEEMRASRSYDYRVVNHRLSQAAGELQKIILKETNR